MFYKSGLIVGCPRMRRLSVCSFHIFPVMNNVYFHRKDNKVFLLFAFSYEMSYY